MKHQPKVKDNAGWLLIGMVVMGLSFMGGFVMPGFKMMIYLVGALIELPVLVLAERYAKSSKDKVGIRIALGVWTLVLLATAWKITR